MPDGDKSWLDSFLEWREGNIRTSQSIDDKMRQWQVDFQKASRPYTTVLDRVIKGVSPGFFFNRTAEEQKEIPLSSEWWEAGERSYERAQETVPTWAQILSGFAEPPFIGGVLKTGTGIEILKRTVPKTRGWTFAGREAEKSAQALREAENIVISEFPTEMEVAAREAAIPGMWKVRIPAGARQVAREATERVGETIGEAIPYTTRQATMVEVVSEGMPLFYDLAQFEKIHYGGRIQKLFEESPALIKAIAGVIKPRFKRTTPVSIIEDMTMTNSARADALAGVDSSTVRAYGKQFEVDEMGKVINVTAKNVGESLRFTDIIENPTKYNLTDGQAKQIDEMAKRIKDQFDIMYQNGVPVKMRSLEEGEIHLGRIPQMRDGEGVEQFTMRVIRNYGTPIPGLEHRAFATAEEAEKALVKFAESARGDPYNVIDAIFRSRYQAVVRQKTIDALKPLGKANVPSITESELKGAKTLFTKAKTVESSLLNMSDATKLAPATKSMMARNYPQVSRLIQEGANITDVRTAMREAVEASESKFARMQHEFNAERIYTVPKAKIRGLEDYAFPKEVSAQIDKAFMQSQGNKATGFANAISRIFRTIQAGFDVAAPFIQGIPLMSRNPRAWGQMVKGQYESMFSEVAKHAYIKDNRDVILRAIKAGASYTAPEMMEGIPAIARFPFYSKWNPLTQLAERYGRGFGFSIDVGKTEHWKAMEKGAGKMGSDGLRALAAHTENMIGTQRPWAIGMGKTQSLIESVFMFYAPQYLRSGIGLWTDMLRGGYTGKEAIKAIGSFVGGYTAVIYGLSKALGQEPEIDPRKSTWGTIKIADHHFGIPSIHTSLIKFIGDIWATAEKDPESFLKFNPFEDKTWRDNPVLKLWRQKASILTGISMDLLTGKTYMGYPSRKDWDSVRDLLALRAVPFSVSPFIESALGKGQPVAPWTFSFQQMGFRIWEVQDYEKERDLLQKYFILDRANLVSGVDYEGDKLTPIGESKLYKTHKDLTEYREKSEAEREKRAATPLEIGYVDWGKSRDANKEWRTGSLLKINQDLQDRKIDTREALRRYREVQGNYFKNTQFIDTLPEFKDVITDLNKPKSKLYEPAMIELAMDEYEQTFHNNPKLENSDGTPNYEQMNLARETFIQKHGKDYYDAIVTNAVEGKDYPPFFANYILFRDKEMWQYWQLPEGQARVDARREHPDWDAWLYTYGYTKTLITPEAKQVAQNFQWVMDLPQEELPEAYDYTANRVAKEKASEETREAWEIASGSRKPWRERTEAERTVSTEVNKFMESRKVVDGSITKAGEVLQDRFATPEQKEKAVKDIRLGTESLRQLYDVVSAYPTTKTGDLYVDALIKQLKLDFIQIDDLKLRNGLK